MYVDICTFIWIYIYICLRKCRHTHKIEKGCEKTTTKRGQLLPGGQRTESTPELLWHVLRCRVFRIVGPSKYV